jgi:excinuclease ABC subunit A
LLTKRTNTSIQIKGAKVHNLKNLSVEIPKNKLVVVTGVSGSGKTSLCIDTLFAEGQRRYVESLSSYARQFLSRMNKPEVEYIKGLCPAIAIDQKVPGGNTRASVGSLTEIYDYLRVLFARLGKTYSPISGELVKKDTVEDVVKWVSALEESSKVLITYPLKTKGNWKSAMDLLIQKGLIRVEIDGALIKIEQILDEDKFKQAELNVVVDRLVVKQDDEDLLNRLSDSIQTAFYESHGDCLIQVIDGEKRLFNNRFEADSLVFDEPNIHYFNFNSPFGACPTCEGHGTVIGIDDELAIPNRKLSIYEDAVVCWKGEKMSYYKKELIREASKFDFPIHKPIQELSSKQYKLLWTGNKHFEGLDTFFKMLEQNSYKIQYRVMLSRYRGKTKCSSCKGMRLKKETNYVKVAGKSIADLLAFPLDELKAFFDTIPLNEYEHDVAKRILFEINTRLRVLNKMSLGYLSLNRMANTLSGGEAQRIKLTRSLGSNLTSSMYILDEPSIGLHPKDTLNLIEVLRDLRDLGNTIVVIEHDEDVIRSADYLIDIGPHAGRFGGEVVFAGHPSNIDDAKSLTAEYLREDKLIPLPDSRRKAVNHIYLKGAKQFDLKNVDITIPLQALTVVAGVSGSGKTTLIKKVLYPALQRYWNGQGERPGEYDSLEGDLRAIKHLELIDQNPLGRSSRSNPVTYTKAYDHIRDLFAKQALAKIRGYKAKEFSFNVEGGRCEACKGDGSVVVEMQFLADVELECESCKGKRFKDEVLEVKYQGKSIYEILEMSIEEALQFFEKQKDIIGKIQALDDVGLGYVKLGQSSSTLSGGEAQRLKLASFLSKAQNPEPILFIFDEPTTGLHFDDVNKLMNAFNALIEIGHTVVIIEHHPDVMKCADWLIELGPVGGKLGGYKIYEGVPEGILETTNSPTKSYLKEKLKN